MMITFRLAAAGDVDAILAMMQRFYALDVYPFDELAARAAVSTLIAHEAYGRIWLIAHAGEVAGYLALTLGYSLEHLGRDAFIDELYLEPGHRGQGIGARALQHVEEECHRLGVRALHLEVERSNHAAQALYRRWAFQERDRMLMTKQILAE